jgi:HAD superfamily hydrolase (TIGR01509 family)
MIKAVVFDFDGMVFDAGGYFSTKLEEELGLDNGETQEFFKNELKDCQRGEMDMQDIVENEYFSLWGWDRGFEEFCDFWFNDGEIEPQMIALIERLKKQGIKTILLTNNEKYRLEYLINEYDLDELFDHIVLPYEIGAIKPEKEVFEHLLTLTKLSAGEILICDDSEKRVDGAADLGFTTLVCQDSNECAKAIREELDLD